MLCFLKGLSPNEKDYLQWSSVYSKTKGRDHTSVLLTFVMTSVVGLYDLPCRRSHTWRPSNSPSDTYVQRRTLLVLIGRRSLLRDIIDSVTPTLFRRTSIVKIVNFVFEKYNKFNNGCRTVNYRSKTSMGCQWSIINNNISTEVLSRLTFVRLG